MHDSCKLTSSIMFVFLSVALDTYLEFLDTSSATEKVASSVFCHAGVFAVWPSSYPFLSLQEPLPTPHIDTVLQQFRHRAVSGSSSDLHRLHPAPPTTHPSGYELRLKQLEKQLSDLLQRSKVLGGPFNKCWIAPAAVLTLVLYLGCRVATSRPLIRRLNPVSC